MFGSELLDKASLLVHGGELKKKQAAIRLNVSVMNRVIARMYEF